MTPLCSRIRPLAAALLLMPLHAAWAAYDVPALEKVEKQVETVAEKTMPAVVSLVHPMGKGMATGSGTIISKNGLILTAAHVVAEQDVTNVIFPDGKLGHAKVLGIDYDRDIAVALITEPGTYPYVELGDTKNVAAGEMVVALGHSGGFDPRRKAPVRFGRVYHIDHEKFIRSDCALVGGDSGGPLFDLNGKVIGVHSFVGHDLSMNNDAPVEALRKDWDRLIMGERWGHNPLESELSKMPKEELAGLDVQGFQARIMNEGAKTKGALAVTPETIAQWLKECGMKEDHIKTLTPAAMTELVQKAAGGLGPMGGMKLGGMAPKLSEEELAGLNLDQFRKRVFDVAMKNGGRLDAKPSELAQWLRECGMKEERVKSLSDAEIGAFMAKALGGAPAKEGDKDKDSKDLAGLDVAKFQKLMLEESTKNHGSVHTTAERLKQMFAECGMDPERAKNLTPADFGPILRKIAGRSVVSYGGGAFPGPIREIVEQDKEVEAAIKPIVDKINPSVVTLLDGDKTLALGTIIRANGFILTKHSEIAKAKGALRVGLSSGITLPGVEVQQFADHDLALVKVAADSMPAVTIPEQHEPLALGKFLFSPSGQAADGMLAMGVVSVKDRALKESGSFVGVELSQQDGFIEIGGLMPEGPAAKAGLKAKDRVLSVNETPVTKSEEVKKIISAMAPGSKIEVKYRRGEEENSAEITLGDRAKLPRRDAKANPVSSIGTEVSDQSTGFPLIFQHDQPLSPEQCGSVVVDLHGQIVGVNIARAGRVNTYAIPAGTVAELLKTVDFEALEKKAAEAPATPPKQS
jgi:serine protease Do